VHSMVEFVDGSTIAQASPPDMRLPISLALDWPHRVPGVGVPLDWTAKRTWDFEPVDAAAFPAVALAKRVGEAGGTYPAVFNAANEQAVAAFHAGRIGFLGIVDTVARVVDDHAADEHGGEHGGELTLEGVLAAESWARSAADATLDA
jgi:1-deoxy-D-xylulose-5-phosphate reductoisomerase